MNTMNNINISFVLPPLFFNKDSIGFNEMLTSELAAICKKNRIHHFISNEKPEHKSSIYILPVQYRDDVFSEWMIQCIKMCKKIGSVVMVCGKSSSVEFRYILKYTEADYVFLGEADITLDEIVKELPEIPESQWHNRLKSIPGLAYINTNKICKTEIRECKEPMDNLPMPEYEYLTFTNVKYPICVMETSRSCHGKCNFCEGYLFRCFNKGNEYRAKSPERVIEEMKYVINTYKCRIFSFSDDNFFADGNKGKQRAIEIANKLISNKIKAKFTIECRADDVEYDIFKLLKQAGLIKVFIGIESGSQSVLDRYHKGITVEDNHKAIRILQELNIKCHPGHILFDPKTTINELWDTVNFFETYISDFFSFQEGYDSRLLYYPQGCSIVQDFWPNKSKEFYEKVWYHGVECMFEHERTEKVYLKYCEYINDQNLFSGTNMLQRRIYCLKKALIETK